MANPLVIVESPAKARTIAGFLGDEFVVESSIGHVRDLPGNAADVPAEYKSEWARLGIDVDNDFKPLYIVSPDKQGPDQEAEGARSRRSTSSTSRRMRIARARPSRGTSSRCSTRRRRCRSSAWSSTRSRPQAIREAIEQPPRHRPPARRRPGGPPPARPPLRLRGARRVALEEGRRGRRRSGACRASAPASSSSASASACASCAAGYWDLDGDFASSRPPATRGRSPVHRHARAARRQARRDRQGLRRSGGVSQDGRRRARRGRRRRAGRRARRGVVRRPVGRAQALPPPAGGAVHDLDLPAGGGAQAAPVVVAGDARRRRRSTRTATSPTCEPTARRCRRPRCTAARDEIGERYGSAVPARTSPASTPTRSRTRRRPTRRSARPATPSARPTTWPARSTRNDARVYELIWKRTIASQMTDAIGETVVGPPRRDDRSVGARRRVRHAAARSSPTRASASPTSRTSTRATTPTRRASASSRRWPRATRSTSIALEPHGHETQPPRPLHRGLAGEAARGARRRSAVDLRVDHRDDPGPRLRVEEGLGPRARRSPRSPSSTLLEQHFPDLVDYAFTARMEDDLDEIAGGNEELVPWLTRVLLRARRPTAARDGPASRAWSTTSSTSIDAAAINSIPIGLDPDGVLIVAKPGKYGARTVKRGDDTASHPRRPRARRAHRREGARAARRAQGRSRARQRSRDGSRRCYAKAGRFGPYVQLGEYDDDAKAEAQDGVALQDDDRSSAITLDEALELLIAAARRGRRSRRRRRDHGARTAATVRT